MLRDEAFTTSENVSERWPEFMSRLKLFSTGWIRSGLRICDLLAEKEATSLTLFPAMSVIAKSVIEI